MLTCLRVRNFAVIDALEVELGPGLNVVTGETGAGKSILVAALQLVLGGKGRAEIVRTGAPYAEVEALFDVSSGVNSSLRARLSELGVEVEDELIIRRKVFATGRTRAYIGGTLATADQLRRLAAGLADISSQHEHHTLIDPRRHLDYLDAFGGLESGRQAVRNAYDKLSEATHALQTHEERIRTRSDREDMLRFQLHEIKELDPQVGELAILEEERGRLRHATQLSDATADAEDILYARDGSMTETLGRVAQQIRDACKLDPALVGAADQLDEALASLEDVAGSLGSYARGIEDDPVRLSEVESRLGTYARLERKYGHSEEEILAHYQTLLTELEQIDSADAVQEELEQNVEQARTAASKVATKLSKARRKKAKSLGTQISAELNTLGMGGARVEVALARIEGGRQELEVEGGRLSPTGIDRAEFLIAPNRGEEARPLAKVASGGELSRALLAVKRVLAGLKQAGLYVFDEVDAGVGGAVAEVIGRKLRDVASHHQVLCITHLAQIAAFGDTHFQVQKHVVKDRTCSEIRLLDEKQRLQEIARMVGGVKITKRTRAAAAEMLQQAQGA